MFPTNAKLTLVTPPAVEPLTVADATNFLRIDASNSPDDAALLGDFITAARVVCENMTNRSFITTGWELTLDYLPAGFGGANPIAFALGMGSGSSGCRPQDGSIRLPRPPLIAVQSIRYLDQGGNAATLDPSTMEVSPGSPGRIAPRWGAIWPFTLPQIASVTISYTAGFGPDPADVPRNVVAALRIMVGTMWANRTHDVPVPSVVETLLQPSTWPSYA